MFRKSSRNMVKNKIDLKCSPRSNRIKRRSGLIQKNSTSSANVKVVVRVRPPNQRELAANHRIVIKILDKKTIIFDPEIDHESFFHQGVQQRYRDLRKKQNKNIQFSFDRVFDYQSNNLAVFEESTKSLINSIMDGYNCSVFVYGATGAGKTHTMLGQTDNPGITVLTMRELFQQIQKFESERDFQLGITYLEVYNETVKDLLNPGPPLHLREDGKFGVCVAGIIFHQIKSPEELFSLLEKGNTNRTQHPTDANAESSRSHAIFQVYVNMKTKISGQRRISKLSMIDLAGSERGAATGCKGARFTEGANINKSLLALGNCINSLADGQRHIPYRDSKLTRLLKDSLGGNCQTVMIANITPSSIHYEDTYNTLKYATRTKKIKSNMQKNVVNCELTIPQYISIVEELKKENEMLKSQLADAKSQQITSIEVKQVETITSTEVKQMETITSTAVNPVEIKLEENIKQVNDSIWRPELYGLLKEKFKTEKQIRVQTHSLDSLKYKINFKESSNVFITKLCVNDDQFESTRKHMNNKLSLLKSQSATFSSQLSELNNKKTALDEQIDNLLDQYNVDKENDIDLLKNMMNLKNMQNELQVAHSEDDRNLFEMEKTEDGKMMLDMANMLHYYHQLLLGHGHLTINMRHNYGQLLRRAQRIRTVTFHDDDDRDNDSKTDKQQNVNSVSVASSSAKKSTSTTRLTPLKRKLNDIDPHVTRFVDENNAMVGVDYADDEVFHSTDNKLNETVVIAQSSINPDLLNSTFNLTNKCPVVPKKKPALKSLKENKVPRVNTYKSINTPTFKKQVTVSNPRSYASKTQRFPLRQW